MIRPLPHITARVVLQRSIRSTSRIPASALGELVLLDEIERLTKRGIISWVFGSPIKLKQTDQCFGLPPPFLLGVISGLTERAAIKKTAMLMIIAVFHALIDQRSSPIMQRCRR